MNALTHHYPVVKEIGELLTNERQGTVVQINERLLSAYWNIGRIIAEYEKENKGEAGDGKQILIEISEALTRKFGKGFSRSNLLNMKSFYLAYPIRQRLSWKLSWSHYCELLSISDPDKRSFYEKESINSG